MSDLEPIGDEVADYLTKLGMPPTLDVARLVEEWEELAGEPFSSMATPAGFEDGELVVEVPDGPAASILKYRAGALLDRLRAALGDGVVERIRIRVGNPKKAP